MCVCVCARLFACMRVLSVLVFVHAGKNDDCVYVCVCMRACVCVCVCASVFASALFVPVFCSFHRLTKEKLKTKPPKDLCTSAYSSAPQCETVALYS